MITDLQTTSKLPQDVFLAHYGEVFDHFSRIAVNDHILTQYVGDFKAGRQMTVTPQHEYLGLFFNMQQSFRYTVDGMPSGPFKNRQFNLVYIPAGVPCRYFLPEGSFLAETLQFDRSFLEKLEAFPMLTEFLDKVARNVPARLSSKHFTARTEVVELLQEIYANDSQPAEELQWWYASKLQEVASMAIDQIRTDYDPAEHRLKCDVRKIVGAKQYLIENLPAPFSMVRLSEVTGLSKDKLQQGFKELYKMTVFEKLTQERIKKAEIALRETRLTVREVARDVGYTRRGFIRVFKRKTSMTPEEFRKKAKEA